MLATGCLPQPLGTRTAAGYRTYTGAAIDRKDWRSTDAMKPFVPRGKCQSHVPACNWYTTGKALQTKYFLTTGKLYPEVSYCAGYQEDTNGNFDAGTLPLDSIRMIANRGIPPAIAGLPEWFDRPRQIPADAQNARMNYRADEWEECKSAEQVVSAILNNDPVNLGIWWFDSDANPGPTGHLPVRGRGGRGGHSVLGCGLVLDYAPSPSRVGVLFNNHHGDSKTPASRDERGRELKFPVWGDDGFGVVPLERVAEGIPVFGCWALRSVTVRNQDLNVPKPIFEGQQ
jgi:hypothetical protein